MAKTLKLTNGKEFFVCDGSTPDRIINVFHTLEEAEGFQKVNLNDKALAGATMDGENVIPPLDEMSYIVDPKNQNITATYFKKPEPIPEPLVMEEPVEESEPEEVIE